MENQVRGLADFATLVGLMSRPPDDEHAESDTAAFVSSLTREQAVAMAIGGTDVLAGLFHAFAHHAHEHDMTGGTLLIESTKASPDVPDSVLADEIREDLTELARSLALRTAVVGHG